MKKDPLHAILEEVRDSWGIRSPDDEHWQAKRRKTAGEYEWVLENLALKQSDKLLDIGCGTGLFLEYINEMVDTSIGIDISETMLKRASRNLAYKHNVSLLRSAAPLLPFCKHIFNKIVIVHAAFGVFIPNPHLWNIYNEDMMDLSADVIKNAFSLLLPYGVLVLTLAPGSEDVGEKVKQKLIPDAMKKAGIGTEDASVTTTVRKLESTYFALVRIEKKS